MRIIVLGGDGFCGWPTSLKLAAAGHTVLIIDNLCRRDIDMHLGTDSVVEIQPMYNRFKASRELGYDMRFVNFNIATAYGMLTEQIKKFEPDTIIHFAEQRSAPYSMLNPDTRRYTVSNNTSTTHNVLSAIVDVDPSIHLVHLGTMGVYGYNAKFGKIPEGYLDVNVNSTGADASILYPTDPGSVYHMTKSMDQLLFQFYNKNWNLNITDLHQGIVWGTQTSETKLHSNLINRFDYDGIYGTVLNRFIVQAAIGHPLTIYGTGEQTRAFIHIEDTARCVQLAVENPPENTDRVRIFNQVSECKRLIDLACILVEQHDAEVSYHENPRKEAVANELVVENQGLKSLGFEPILLDNSLMDDVRFIVEQNSNRVNKDVILNSPKW